MGIALAEEFEGHRDRLRGLALRMLATHHDAEDAVHEAWVRLSRSDRSEIDNLGGWLTTVTARICLNMLRSRATRGEVPLDALVPDPTLEPEAASGPEDEALLTDEVGVALLVVLESLSPTERLAFVLHDVFAVPFDEIATLIDRSPEATRQLASRARRRVRGRAVPDTDLRGQRTMVDAFFAAARDGDLDRLVAVLHPEVVLRSDGGHVRPSTSAVVHGATSVARRALAFTMPKAVLHPVRVNGLAGVIVTVDDEPFAIMGFTVVAGSITAIEVLADPSRIDRLVQRSSFRAWFQVPST